jgi:replication initiator protein RepSA
VTEPAAKTRRVERMAMPLAQQVVKDLAIEHGACIRPIQLRRTNLDTGQVEQVLVPCGHTLAHVCPSCAERARSLRAVQCREGWHLEDEPDLTPDPATDDQQWWVMLRAEAQQSRDQAAGHDQDTTDFDALIAEPAMAANCQSGTTRRAGTSTRPPGRYCPPGMRPWTPSAPMTCPGMWPGSGTGSTPRACWPDPRKPPGASAT